MARIKNQLTFEAMSSQAGLIVRKGDQFLGTVCANTEVNEQFPHPFFAYGLKDGQLVVTTNDSPLDVIVDTIDQGWDACF